MSRTYNFNTSPYKVEEEKKKQNTEAMLDIFFDGNYGNMPIDVVNGKVKK